MRSTTGPRSSTRSDHRCPASIRESLRRGPDFVIDALWAFGDEAPQSVKTIAQDWPMPASGVGQLATTELGVVVMMGPVDLPLNVAVRGDTVIVLMPDGSEIGLTMRAAERSVQRLSDALSPGEGSASLDRARLGAGNLCDQPRGRGCGRRPISAHVTRSPGSGRWRRRGRATCGGLGEDLFGIAVVQSFQGDRGASLWVGSSGEPSGKPARDVTKAIAG